MPNDILPKQKGNHGASVGERQEGPMYLASEKVSQDKSDMSNITCHTCKQKGTTPTGARRSSVLLLRDTRTKIVFCTQNKVALKSMVQRPEACSSVCVSYWRPSEVADTDTVSQITTTPTVSCPITFMTSVSPTSRTRNGNTR